MTADARSSGAAPPRDDGGRMPVAALRPRRRVSLAWIVPVLATVAAAWLAVAAWSDRGVTVTVQLEEGYGLKPGDEVRHRGVTVGEVRQVELEDETGGVRVVAALRQEEADRIARAGSRFWVVRPELGLSGVAGLETLLGPRYLAVAPGHGPRQRHFVGLADPPVVETERPGDLEIILTAPQQGSLRRGTAVMFREVRVGTIRSAGLTSDGGAVEARAHIDRAYAQLIRRGTRFWDVGGLEASVGLSGVRLEAASLATLLSGGIALATPDDAGPVVRTGHRFVLESEPPEDWLAWQPLAVIGSSMLPPGAPLPGPLRARAVWEHGRFISRQRSRSGWVLQTTEGLLGPADLLAPETAADETALLEVAGQEVPLAETPQWTDEGVALIDVHLDQPAWSGDRLRAAEAPEDCLAVADPTATPLPLAAARLEPADGGWAVDPAVSIGAAWHGAAVVARNDGALVGLVLVDDGQARVALLPGHAAR